MYYYSHLIHFFDCHTHVEWTNRLNTSRKSSINSQNCWQTTPLTAVQFISTPLLQGTDHPILAFIVSLATLLMMLLLTSVFFNFTDKHNAHRLFFAVLSNNALSFIFLTQFTVLSIKEITCNHEDVEDAAAVVEDENDGEQQQILLFKQFVSILFKQKQTVHAKIQ